MHTRPSRLTLTKTHLHSSCHQQISGNQKCTSIHRSLGCSHRSGHKDGQGSANTRSHLRGRKDHHHRHHALGKGTLCMSTPMRAGAVC